MNVEEKRKLADEMLAWLKETERQSGLAPDVVIGRGGRRHIRLY